MLDFTPRWLDPELELFKKSAAHFIETEIEPNDAAARQAGSVGHEVWRKAGAANMLCLDIPAKYGGVGGDFRHEVIFEFELARRSLNGFGIGGHMIAAHYVLNHGTEEQKRRYLPRMACGELVGAIAMSEPGTGSDLKAIRTTAVREGDHYVANGSKVFISNGLLSGLIVLVCRTGGEGARGLSLLLVERDKSTVHVSRPMKKFGHEAQDTAELFFDDCRVPVENLLGLQEGRGFAQMMDDLRYERLNIVTTAQAAMEAAYETTLDYVRSRYVFGKAVFDYQNTKFKLAEVATLVSLGRMYFDNCVENYMADKIDNTAAAMAKLWFTDTQSKVIDECLQFFGGYGIMREYLIARLYADHRGQRIWGGTNEIMKEIIARSL